jgi:hypothetical protein
MLLTWESLSTFFASFKYGMFTIRMGWWRQVRASDCRDDIHVNWKRFIHRFCQEVVHTWRVWNISLEKIYLKDRQGQKWFHKRKAGVRVSRGTKPPQWEREGDALYTPIHRLFDQTSVASTTTFEQTKEIPRPWERVYCTLVCIQDSAMPLFGSARFRSGVVFAVLYSIASGWLKEL